MWPFDQIFQRKRPFDLHGFTDWHCHILPGVDDGIQTMDEALEVLAAYEAAGIRQVWLTPHIMEDVPNTTAALKERFAELRQAYGGPVQLHLAAENMLDGLFHQRLAAGDLLPIGPRGDMLLVETSYFNPPANLRETLRAIQSAGFYPLLAHPERYAYIHDLKTYRELAAMGVRFQLNLLSLTGHYGPAPRDKARRLLAANLYTHAATDLHRPSHLQELKDVSLAASIMQSLNSLMKI